MSKEIKFSSSYFLRILKGDLHPFTPNILTITDERIEFRRRNWHMVSYDTETLHFRNITGITVDNHLFGSTLKIKSTGHDPIFIYGFWKGRASEIKNICTKFISGSFENPSNGENFANPSPADELYKLKALLETGVITNKEFQQLKRKTLSE